MLYFGGVLLKVHNETILVNKTYKFKYSVYFTNRFCTKKNPKVIWEEPRRNPHGRQ